MSIQSNLISIKDSLVEGVTLVAVSKTKSKEMIQEAYDAGQRIFGENRPLEMQEKSNELPQDIQWHMIGHLQTNKVKYIIDFVDLIHGVDSLKLLYEIDKRASRISRKVDCLLQVHIAQEEQKFGFEKDEVLRFFKMKEFLNFEHINFRGLMGMATNTQDVSVLRSEFKGLNSAYKEILSIDGDKSLDFSILSMGMSADYLVAVEEGSTMIRVGSSIFGKRN